jgi:hypothetical protein
MNPQKSLVELTIKIKPLLHQQTKNCNQNSYFPATVALEKAATTLNQPPLRWTCQRLSSHHSTKIPITDSALTCQSSNQMSFSCVYDTIDLCRESDRVVQYIDFPTIEWKFDDDEDESECKYLYTSCKSRIHKFVYVDEEDDDDSVSIQTKIKEQSFSRRLLNHSTSCISSLSSTSFTTI